MGRSLYICLIGLHPRHFRERFGEEMIAIFDDAAGNRERGALFTDVLVSLFRQWALRPPNREPALSMALPATSLDTPVFQMLDSSFPRRSALVNGAIMTLVSFLAMTFFIGRGGHLPRFFVGAKPNRPQVLGVGPPSVGRDGRNTLIKLKTEGEDALNPFAKAYFRMIRVLDVLDADHDWIISPREIITAPATLRRIDWNHDGKLSPEECGFYSGEKPKTKMDPRFVRRARLDFMRLNPVLAALDADHDGEISAEEIKNSPTALRTLDKNHDGSLIPDEVLPDALTVERH
jgi:hypothetical protein